MFKASDLSVLAYANNFTLWHYTTTNNLTTLLEQNYFNPAADMLRKNDLMIVNADTDGRSETKFLIVTKSENGEVTVATY